MSSDQNGDTDTAAYRQLSRYAMDQGTARDVASKAQFPDWALDTIRASQAKIGVEVKSGDEMLNQMFLGALPAMEERFSGRLNALKALVHESPMPQHIPVRAVLTFTPNAVTVYGRDDDSYAIGFSPDMFFTMSAVVAFALRAVTSTSESEYDEWVGKIWRALELEIRRYYYKEMPTQDDLSFHGTFNDLPSNILDLAVQMQEVAQEFLAAHELAHIALGHCKNQTYAFQDLNDTHSHRDQRESFRMEFDADRWGYTMMGRLPDTPPSVPAEHVASLRARVPFLIFAVWHLVNQIKDSTVVVTPWYRSGLTALVEDTHPWPAERIRELQPLLTLSSRDCAIDPVLHAVWSCFHFMNHWLHMAQERFGPRFGLIQPRETKRFDWSVFTPNASLRAFGLKWPL